MANAFNNLTLTGGNKSLSSNISIAGSLVLTGAILNTTEEFNVSLLPAASLGFGETAQQHIVGQIVTLPRTLSANSSETFGNIGISITNGSADLGEVTVLRRTGTPVTILGNQSVKRQFIVSNTGANTSPGTNITLNYYAHDLNDPTETAFDLYRGSSEENLARIAYNIPYESISVNSGSIRGLFTLFSSQINPLPVELISFKAQHHAKGVNLTWATASELDNKGFEVQVSTDSKNFQKIGFVESKVGTTSIKQDYSFLDMKAVSGTRYYRLKQIDFDGKFEYSAIKAVILEEGNGAVAAYPNPFEDVVTVKLTGTEARQVSAKLTDAMGKVILETTEETAGNSISVNTASVTNSGLYVLYVVDSGTRHAFKLIKR